MGGFCRWVEMLTVGREGGRRKERGGEGPHTQPMVHDALFPCHPQKRTLYPWHQFLGIETRDFPYPVMILEKADKFLL